MRTLSEIQAEFARALRDPALPAPPDVRGPDGLPAPRRFAVYRNNVIVGLTNAVTGVFPVIERIVGADFFRAMARSYVLASPPRSPVLLDYGADFPAFIEGFAPAAPLPYLPDVARIERAWREAYHAADAEPLRAPALAGIAADRLPGLVFRLHPSLRVVRSRFPALTIWRMNRPDGAVVPVDMAVGEDALIVRPVAEVEVRPMPPGGAEFVLALAAGEPLGTAAAAAIEADARFDLGINLAGLLAVGALAGVSG